MNNDDSEDIMAIFDSSENTDSNLNLWQRETPDEDHEYPSENDLDHIYITLNTQYNAQEWAIWIWKRCVWYWNLC